MLFPSEKGTRFPLTGGANTRSAFSIPSGSTDARFPVGFNPVSGQGAGIVGQAQGPGAARTRRGRRDRGNRGRGGEAASLSTALHASPLHPRSTRTGRWWWWWW